MHQYKKRLQAPYDLGASLFARVFFTSIAPLLALGAERPLEHTDLYQLPENLRAGPLTELIVAGMRDDDTPRGSNDEDSEARRVDCRAFPFCFVRNVPPVLRVLFGIMRPHFLYAGCCRLSHDLLSVINPLILSELIRAAGGTSSFPTLWSALGGQSAYMYFMASFFFFFAFGSYMLLQHHHNNNLKCQLMIRSGLQAAFYRKCLRLTPAARGDLTTGLIMTMISTDAQRVSESCPSLHHLWSCPLLICLAITSLIQFIGIAALGGLAWLIAVLAIETVLARLALKTNKKVLKMTDSRLELVGQVIKNIRVVKSYGWQSSFANRIIDSRSAEVSLIRIAALFKALITMLLQVTPVLVALCTFSLYTHLSDVPITAVQAFTSLSLFSILRQPLTQMPKVLSNLVDALACFPRINRLMNSDELSGSPQYDDLADGIRAEARRHEQRLNELDGIPVRCEHTASASEAAGTSAIVPRSTDISVERLPSGSIHVPNLDFRWEKSTAEREVSVFLPSVRVSIAPGAFVMCVGPVASGKSTLFMALLGQLDAAPSGATSPQPSVPASAGPRAHIQTLHGRVALVQQTPWICNDTVRGNICFGAPFDERWYARVVDACALGSDLELLALGDLTEIGERGVNMSGGQKARVALARAVYSRADIYLLDSPLAALDVHVGQFIFEQCFRALLRGKTILLVTHDLSLTRFADHVIVMQNSVDLASSEHAQATWRVRIAEQGTHAELMARGGVFHALQTSTAIASPTSPRSAPPSSALVLANAPLLKESTKATAVASSLQAAPRRARFSATDVDVSYFGFTRDQIQLSMREDGLVDFFDCDDKASVDDNLEMNEHGVILVPSDARTQQHIFDLNCELREIKSDGREMAPPSPSVHGSSTASLPRAAAGGKLKTGEQISVEKHFKGENSLDTYMAFLRACGLAHVAMLLCLLLASPLINSFNDLWLTIWSSQTRGTKKGGSGASTSLANSVYAGWTTPDSPTTMYLRIYATFALASICILILGSTITVQVGLNGSKRLHDKMMHALLRSPMSFFDTTPVGRIVNRCSSDVEGIDQRLAQEILDLCLLVALLSVNMFMICLNLPAFLVAFGPAMYLFYHIQRRYRCSSRELKRLYSISKSPIFAAFQEMLEGVTTIRAFNGEPRVIFQNMLHIDHNNEAWLALQAVNRWLGLRLDLLGAVILLCIGMTVVTFQDSLSPGLVGLLLGYGVSMTGYLNRMIRQSLDTEQDFSSVERVLEYTHLTAEDESTRAPALLRTRADLDSVGTTVASRTARDDEATFSALHPPRWPSEGAIVFENVSARYREGLALVVHNLNATIPARAKIGVCGRTGAGKTSLLSLLFRLIECVEGRVLIDGRDVATVDLEYLRRSLSIIPQEPVLFDGSIRFNLDPFGTCTDSDLWAALRRCQMENNIRALPGQLDESVSDCGGGFSVGEKQLFCMARALLRPSRILVMDEATANVDFRTDAIIQNMIKTEFADRTVLTIAHRLNTVMWMDRVMVLERGNLVEFDSPAALMSNPVGIFRSMVDEHEQE